MVSCKAFGYHSYNSSSAGIKILPVVCRSGPPQTTATICRERVVLRRPSYQIEYTQYYRDSLYVRGIVRQECVRENWWLRQWLHCTHSSNWYTIRNIWQKENPCMCDAGRRKCFVQKVNKQHLSDKISKWNKWRNLCFVLYWVFLFLRGTRFPWYYPSPLPGEHSHLKIENFNSIWNRNPNFLDSNSSNLGSGFTTMCQGHMGPRLCSW